MQEYASDFIGKPLFTRGGERAGYVKNVQTDARLSALRNLECCDDEEEEFILPLSALAQAGKDALIVRSLTAQPCKNCRPAPFGAQVYGEDGALLGTASDFLREGKTLTGILLSDGSTLPADRLAGVRDAAMVSLSSPARRVPRPKKAKTAEEEGDAAVKTSPDEGGTAMRAAQSVAETKQERPHPPVRRAAGARAGSALLTGKILPADLTDVRGNLLAAAGTVVTAEVISRAMAHGKLFALTLLCCGNGYGR